MFTIVETVIRASQGSGGKGGFPSLIHGVHSCSACLSTIVKRGAFFYETDPKPTSVTLEPLRYHELHDSVVPREFRALGYEGYRLLVATARPKWCRDAQTACLNEDFRLVQDPVPRWTNTTSLSL